MEDKKVGVTGFVLVEVEDLRFFGIWDDSSHRASASKHKLFLRWFDLKDSGNEMSPKDIFKRTSFNSVEVDIPSKGQDERRLCIPFGFSVSGSNIHLQF
jgi:hypothetical protein